MDHRIVVTADPLENLLGIEFDLIMANLRPPTLRQILPLVVKLSAEDAHWVLSGFRREAIEDVAQMLPLHMTEILSQQDACGWAAMTVRCISSAQNT
jgi:ribosomal protein L11 methylase PrmA